MFEIDIAYTTPHQIEKGKNMPMEIKGFRKLRDNDSFAERGFFDWRAENVLLVR